jgi:alpha-tubulin suppressor-like RCC1 family protein
MRVVHSIKDRYKKWVAVLMSLLLIGIGTVPASVAAKSASAESWGQGTVQMLAGGMSHNIALKSDGTVVAWGDTSEGQSTVPTGLKGIVAIDAGGYYSMALQSDGTVVAWGINTDGVTNVPIGLTNVVAITAGFEHAMALKSNGTVVAWGRNDKGQASVPAELTDVVAITAGEKFSIALKSDGTVVAWGYDYYNQRKVPAGLTGVVAISAGADHAMALKSNGTVVTWGRNHVGQANVPESLKDIVAIDAGYFHSMALKSDGTVVAWGKNDFGQTNVPTGLKDVVVIAAGGYTPMVLKSDGTVIAWGFHFTGQTNVPAGLSSPVKAVSISAAINTSMALKLDGTVGVWGRNNEGQANVPAGLKGIAAITMGGNHAMALKSDGTLVAWGKNGDGQSTVPTDLKDVIAISAGNYHSMALKSDGTIMAWGLNINGQSTVPSGLTDVVAIVARHFFSMALKSDGTIVAWGTNSSGQTNVPTGLKGAIAIAAGAVHAMALKSDGTVEAWGRHDEGQTSVPTGLKDVVAIAAGDLFSMALKADGTIVAWGSNGEATVPAGLTDVVAIAAGGSHSMALKSDGTIVAWGLDDHGQSTVPGTSYLSNLILDGNAVSTPFDSEILHYSKYVGSSATSIDVAATVADPLNIVVLVNNLVYTSGTTMAVSLSEITTEIPVKVVPYFLSDKEYTITVTKDLTAPGVSFGMNGSTEVATNAATTVMVSDLESGVDVSTLKYVWTTDTSVPTSRWTSFTSGDTLKKAEDDGMWYLHVQAHDNVGNTVDAISSPFLLDNTAPLIPVTMKMTDGNSYVDKTWTNQDVTVSVNALDDGGIASLSYSLDGAVTWSSYTDSITLQNDSVHSLIFKAVDIAGNETVERRTVNISRSGLKLTSTLTKEDGVVYASGSWTNASVTVSVYGESGPSGIAALTYTLDAEAAQTYANEELLTIASEGQHQIEFQIKDTAGNKLTAPLTVNIDRTMPVVDFGKNGDDNWAVSGSTTVMISDSGGSGIDTSTLRYAWTLDTIVPSIGWTSFGNGDTLTKTGVDGEWYLHIQAQDNAGNSFDAVSNRFMLDPTTAQLSGLSISEGALNPAFAEDTFSYTARVANAISSITVTPKSEIAKSTITVSVNGGMPEPVTSGQSSDSAALNVGVNTIEVTVAAQNGSRQTYTLTVTREAAEIQAPVEPPSTSDVIIDPDPSSEIMPINDPYGGYRLIVSPSNVEHVTREDGVVFVQIAIPEETLNLALNQMQDEATRRLTIEVDDMERAVLVKLSAASIAAAVKSASDIVIEVETASSSFRLVIGALDLEGLTARLGVKLNDLNVNIMLERVNKSVEDEVRHMADKLSFLLAGGVFSFQVTAESGGQVVEIRDFGRTYMERAIVLDVGAAAGNLTGVLYDPAMKTFAFMPSRSGTRSDGRQEIIMQSPHNSLYTILETKEKSFVDMVGHWAKADVELLASKLIVQGITDDSFAPDTPITRAEFTGLLVRALGLAMEKDAANPGFKDVAVDAWYAPAINAAIRVELVSGITADSFAPNERITREQMAVLIARAMKLMGKPSDSADQVSGQLAKFADRASISSWAHTAVANIVTAGIVAGISNNKFAPSEYATRAQATAILRRFLHHVRLIE